MEFDITHLDKKIVIQALFAYAEPTGFGEVEYFVRKVKGDNVEELTDSECETILGNAYKSTFANITPVLDYYKGKPMKVEFVKKPNGRILIDTDDYDYSNGKYRFLEAFLDTFLYDEIYITKKGNSSYLSHGNHMKLPKEVEKNFKTIINQTILKQSRYGKYWAINEEIIDYTPLYLRYLKQ